MKNEWYLGDIVDFLWVTCVHQQLDQLAIGHQELWDQVNIPVPKIYILESLGKWLKSTSSTDVRLTFPFHSSHQGQELQTW